MYDTGRNLVAFKVILLLLLTTSTSHSKPQLRRDKAAEPRRYTWDENEDYISYMFPYGINDAQDHVEHLPHSDPTCQPDCASLTKIMKKFSNNTVKAKICNTIRCKCETDKFGSKCNSCISRGRKRSAYLN
ncbi:uncharacterized protein LOC111339673 isoform X2 [Stylophora pistillata]|uniref:uncharacterized protein LOC111339673 isoform X2 n=1 Tax=Stylophora pistillata TaxID=50429 RepID=UPI000C04DFEE|nr:uncharacterized protein LOC111339673 isoform X2 [Stylophora pistillata]